MLDIINRYVPENDYQNDLRKINIAEPDEQIRKIISSYKTPNKSYLSGSVRGLECTEVSFETLNYIIFECFKCNDKEKFEAMILAMYKLYNECEEHKKIKAVEMLREDFLSYWANPVASQQDFKYLDKYSQNNEQLFYLIEITIGNNKILKYGITDDKMRKRLSLLKANIKDRYKNQHISFYPLMLIECSDNIKFEEEMKIAIIEHGFEKSGYGFKGYTETVKYKYQYELIAKVLNPLLKDLNAKVVFTKDDKFHEPMTKTSPQVDGLDGFL